jgi:hypothetical protein
MKGLDMGHYASTKYRLKVVDRAAFEKFTGGKRIGFLIGEYDNPDEWDGDTTSGTTSEKCLFLGEERWLQAGVVGTIEMIDGNDPDDRTLYIIGGGRIVSFRGEVTVTYPGAASYMLKVGVEQPVTDGMFDGMDGAVAFLGGIVTSGGNE